MWQAQNHRGSEAAAVVLSKAGGEAKGLGAPGPGETLAQIARSYAVSVSMISRL
jgi:hypothetical protein